MRLGGARVLVTGASGGIGRAISVAMAGRGAFLIVSGRRSADLERLATEVGGRAVVADLAAPSGIDALIGEAGEVDVLVANAALPGSGPLSDYSAVEVDRAIDVNLRAPIQLAHALVPAMVERGRGHVVLVSSLQGLAATPGAALYVATKFGLRGFGLALRQDLRGTGVGVSVLLPGFVSDAGLFADSGATLPPGVGTRSPEQVAVAAVAVVERDRAERTVAPTHLALGSYLGGLLPAASARVQRAFGASAIAEAVASGQVDKR